MEITRNVILDLLPLYIADEVSADTRALIENYLETDPQLANFVKRSAAMELPGDIPVPLTKDDEMKTFKKAKRSILMQIISMAGLISLILFLLVMFMFYFSS